MIYAHKKSTYKLAAKACILYALFHAWLHTHTDTRARTHTHTHTPKMASRVITFIAHSVSAMHHFRWALPSLSFTAWHWINANEVVVEQISCSKMNNTSLFCCCWFFFGLFVWPTLESSDCVSRGDLILRPATLIKWVAATRATLLLKSKGHLHSPSRVKTRGNIIIRLSSSLVFTAPVCCCWVGTWC